MRLRIKRFSTFVLFEPTHEGRRHTAHTSAALALTAAACSTPFVGMKPSCRPLPGLERVKRQMEENGRETGSRKQRTGERDLKGGRINVSFRFI